MDLLKVAKLHFDDAFMNDVLKGEDILYSSESICLIQWLMETVERLREREGRHIDLKMHYVERIKEAEEDVKKLNRTICELRKKTSFRVYEENLRLLQEIERLKGKQHEQR